MHLELVTLHGQKLNKEVYEVLLPTANGDIAVYPGHMPLVTVAIPGVIRVRHQKSDPDSLLEYFAGTGGIVEVSNKRVRVLVDEADAAEEIVEAEAEAALKRAQEMRSEAGDQVSLEHAQQLIDRHAVRLKVAELKRRHHRR
jgi:F-type H+-transporting ATPase subunit epsilon